MARSNRNQTSQSKHDREVKRLANDYKNKGYDVDADISGYSKPPTVGGLRPDIKAKKGGHETIVEVETPDSVDSTRDMQQHGAFQRWARRDPKRHYKRQVMD